MTAQTTLDTTARGYLRRVRRLLAGTDPEAAASLLEGIIEEFEGLDDAAVRSKIEQIGSPEDVTADLRAEVANRPHDAGWYTWLTAFLVTFGGFVLPLLGWIGGVVLLWNSKTWQKRHHIIGTAVWPLVTLAGVVGLMPWALNAPAVTVTSEQTVSADGITTITPENAPLTGVAPWDIGTVVSPLLGALLFGLLLAVGIWLIIEAQRIKQRHR